MPRRRFRAPRGGRLTDADAAAIMARAVPERHASGRVVSLPIRGYTIEGEPLELHGGRPRLLLFVAPGCDGCRDLMGLVGAGTCHGAVTTGVVPMLDGALPDAALTALAVGGGEWLVDEALHGQLGIRRGPYYCLLGANGTVLAEGLPLGAGDAEAACARALAARP